MRTTLASIVSPVLLSPTGDDLPLSDDMSWFATLLGRFPRGANLLLSGDPGVGKSTLAQQLAISAAIAGERVLVIATEQTRTALISRMTALAAPLNGRGMDDLPIDIVDDIGDLALLPQLLARQIFARNGRFAGTGLIVVDSMHGHGNSPQDRRFYEAIYEYMRTASAAGITTIAMAHMTKAREISGPRALEHMIDTSIILRHGVACRALYIPKNRTGASITEPFSIVMDADTTRMVPSPLAVSSSARVRTISCDGIVQIEVGLNIPRHERGFIKSPGLSASDVSIVMDVLSRIHAPAQSIGSLGVTVRAPGGVRFRREFSLAIAVAAAAALARVEIPNGLIVAGDLDLRGNVYPVSDGMLRVLDDACVAGTVTHVDRLLAKRGDQAGGEVDRPFHWVDINSIQAAVAHTLLADGGRDGECTNG